MSNGKGSRFKSWTNRKDLKKKMSHYFPKSFRSFARNINVKVGLSNYAKKLI